MPIRALVVIFGVALLVRLVATLLIRPRLGADSMSYVSRAQLVVDGGLSAVSSLPIEHSPLYSIFLVPSLLLGVDSLWYAVLGQAVLGAATAVLLARFTARATGSQTAGWIAGLLAAVHLTFVFWGVYVLSDSLFVFVLALTADRLLVLGDSRRPLLDSATAGALLLVSVASRPTAAPFAVAIVGFAAIAAHGQWRRFLLLVLGMALPASVLVCVWIAAAALGLARSPLDTAVRAADWGRSAVYVGLIWTEEGRATFGVDVGVAAPPAMERMTAAEREAFVLLGADQRPLEFIAAHPSWFLQQSARKALLMWTPVLPEYSLAHRAVRFVYFVPLYALSALGLVTIVRQRPAFASLMIIAILAFTLTCMITFVDYDQRYRLPVEVFLIPLASVGLTWLLERRPPPLRAPTRLQTAGRQAVVDRT